MVILVVGLNFSPANANNYFHPTQMTLLKL